MDDRGYVVRISVCAILFFTPYPQRTDRHWNPPCVRFKGCRVPFPGGKNGWGVKLTTPLHLEPRLRMNGAVRLFALYAFMACVGTTFLKMSAHKRVIEVLYNELHCPAVESMQNAVIFRKLEKSLGNAIGLRGQMLCSAV